MGLYESDPETRPIRIQHYPSKSPAAKPDRFPPVDKFQRDAHDAAAEVAAGPSYQELIEAASADEPGGGSSTAS
ncbi:hypothetical protein GCM10025780_24140 [Frondihabitans cladoniiphilus]|uniref:Uncharacterized protein n=1 Tax=Frondihabitans cladoniiphilus TaxID=715785 RepID=A0ABP8W425_9MICO